MNDLTPDVIAQIATRLYNELPGTHSVPTTEIGAQQVISQEASPAALPPMHIPTMQLPAMPPAAPPDTGAAAGIHAQFRPAPSSRRRRPARTRTMACAGLSNGSARRICNRAAVFVETLTRPAFLPNCWLRI